MQSDVGDAAAAPSRGFISFKHRKARFRFAGTFCDACIFRHQLDKLTFSQGNPTAGDALALL